MAPASCKIGRTHQKFIVKWEWVYPGSGMCEIAGHVWVSWVSFHVVFMQDTNELHEPGFHVIRLSCTNISPSAFYSGPQRGGSLCPDDGKGEAWAKVLVCGRTQTNMNGSVRWGWTSGICLHCEDTSAWHRGSGVGSREIFGLKGTLGLRLA